MIVGLPSASSPSAPSVPPVTIVCTGSVRWSAAAVSPAARASTAMAAAAAARDSAGAWSVRPTTVTSGPHSREPARSSPSTYSGCASK
ncbi:hypothetical protein SFUMM280S_03483 [Streptomyces fumanus]